MKPPNAGSGEARKQKNACAVYPSVAKEPMVRHRFINRWAGALVLFACFPALLFVIRSGTGWGILLLGAKLSAFLAFGWLCTVLVLSSRHHLLEQRLGGLDAMYLMHHMAGMATMALMAAHPLLLLAAYRSSLSSSSWVLPWASAETLLGTAALLLAALLVALSICHFLPYQRWLTTHRGMGFVLVLSAVHTFRIGSNVFGIVELMLYLYLAVGVAAYVYKVGLYYRYGPRFDGTVASVSVDEHATFFTLSLSRAIDISPGQFVYVSIRDSSIPSEAHPFSVVQASGNALSLAAAPSGDYTLKLRALSNGVRCYVYGPYGAMHRHYFRASRPALWIAGGIGITPFVSLWNHAVNHDPSRKVLLIWSVRGPRSPFLSKMIAGAEGDKGYMLWDTLAKDRLTGEVVAQLASFDVRDADVMLCGPDAMMYSLSKQLISLGVKSKNIYYETFSYRD